MNDAKCTMRKLKAEVAFDLLPETGFPAVDIKLIRIERRDRHRRIRSNDLIGRNILRPQIELALFALTRICQSIDCQAQVRQDVVINNIVKEYGVRIERFLGQYDAVIKGFIVANGSIPAIGYSVNFRSIGQQSL
jgi:hypothetical protein